MNLDAIHTAIACTALVLLAAGSAAAWGPGYAAILTGAILLAGVIYARTRT